MNEDVAYARNTESGCKEMYNISKIIDAHWTLDLPQVDLMNFRVGYVRPPSLTGKTGGFEVSLATDL